MKNKEVKHPVKLKNMLNKKQMMCLCDKIWLKQQSFYKVARNGPLDRVVNLVNKEVKSLIFRPCHHLPRAEGKNVDPAQNSVVILQKTALIPGRGRMA